MNFHIECEVEDDGRWLAEVSELPGVLAYGASANEAMTRAEVLALRVLAEQLEHGETLPVNISIPIPAAARARDLRRRQGECSLHCCVSDGS